MAHYGDIELVPVNDNPESSQKLTEWILINLHCYLDSPTRGYQDKFRVKFNNTMCLLSNRFMNYMTMSPEAKKEELANTAVLYMKKCALLATIFHRYQDYPMLLKKGELPVCLLLLNNSAFVDQL